jgi:glycosyltransferase involved in cell wall biosynthesis
VKKLAVLASHPVYYQTPLWQRLAVQASLDVTVFFKGDMGVGSYHDPEFGKTINWNLPLFEGYRHEFIKSTVSFLATLRRGRFDAILLNGWNSLLVWITLLSAKAFGIQVLLRSENPWNQESSRTGLRHALRRMALKFFFGRVDAFLYIGKENKEFYEKYGVPASKLFSTPYAVDNERLVASVPDPASARQEIRRQLGIGEDDVVILTAGKLIPKKRPLDLLKAYEVLSFPNKALVFAGEGELRGSLEKYVTEHNIKNVRFAGFIGQGDIGGYYAAADIFVLPSGPGETWGLVLNEAMCFGLPVIASEIVGSAADLVRPAENGYIFKLGDTTELVGKISTLAEHPDLRRKFGQRSKEIMGEYTYEADVTGVLKALETLS